MKDLNDDLISEEISPDVDLPSDRDLKVRFVCPDCGEISRDDVIFLCNTCSQDQLIYQNGIYMCPSCLIPGENFECMLCGSKEVKMVEKGKGVKNTAKPKHKTK